MKKIQLMMIFFILFVSACSDVSDVQKKDGSYFGQYENNNDGDRCLNAADAYPDDPARCGDQFDSTTSITGSGQQNTTTTPTATQTPASTYGGPDVDKDGIPDSEDLDNDNDKINDAEDCSPLDKDRLKSWDTDKDKSCDNVDSPFSLNEWVSIPASSPDGFISFSVQGTYPIRLSPYRILKYEVSATDYNKCVTSGICQTTLVASSNLPINNVNWEQAKTYCNWVGGDLPTEAQWEYASGAADGRIYPWGSDTLPKANLKEAIICEPKPLVANPLCEVNTNLTGASPYGLLNLIGNVGEWTRDGMRADFYACTQSSSCSLGLKVIDLDPWNDMEPTNWKTMRGFSKINNFSQLAVVNSHVVWGRLALDKDSGVSNDAYSTNYLTSGALGMRCVIE